MPQAPNFKPQTLRIAITGPESTGKSELAEQLAMHYMTAWVPEYAREYLEDLDRKYNYGDILSIAKGQYEREEQMVADAGSLLFCDTEFIVNKIWCDDKFGKCHNWILEMIDSHPYDLYLLCNADLPWEEDPLRENPGDRERLFGLYFHELKSRDFNFEVISGLGQERVKNAIRIVDNFAVNFPGTTVY